MLLEKATRRKRFLLSLPLLAILAAENPFTLAARAGYAVADINRRSLVSLEIGDAILVAAMVLIAAWPAWLRAGIDRGAAAAARFGRAVGGTPFPLALLCFSGASLWLYFSALGVAGIPVWRPMALYSLLVHGLFSGCLLAIGISLIGRISPGRFLGALVVIPILAVYPAEWISVSYGGGRLAPEMARWVTLGMAANIAETGLVVRLLIWLILLAVGAWPCPACFPPAGLARSGRAGIGGGGLRGFGPSAGPFGRVLGLSCSQNGTGAGEGLADELVTREMEDPTVRFVPLPPASPPNRDLRFRSAEQIDQLLDRKRGEESGAPSPVGDRPFKHVVLIFCESLSLDFIDRNNPRHPPGLTPFLDSLPASPDQVWTISSPTSRGIATHLCSHPNADGLFTLGFPHSVVRAFDAAGWRTAIFRSSDGDFDQGVRRFAQMGFREQFDSKWLAAHEPGARELDLGVCDQETFAAAADYWSAHRAEKTRVSILTVDTHMPTGRLNYGDREYPEAPDFVAQDFARLYLRAVFRFDVTLQRFFADLQGARSPG